MKVGMFGGGFEELGAIRYQIMRQSNEFINYLHPKWFEETLTLISNDALDRSMLRRTPSGTPI